jgi:hypothetical protein
VKHMVSSLTRSTRSANIAEPDRTLRTHNKDKPQELVDERKTQ